MLIVFIGNKQLRELSKFMAQWLEEVRADIKKIALGKATDPETKAAVADLTSRLTANEASDADVRTAVSELIKKLAESTPAGTPTEAPTGAPTPAPAPAA